MLQLDNDTNFAVAIAALADESGVDAMWICAKATFTLHPTVALAPEQRPVTMVDRYRGEASRTSLAAAGEMHLAKSGTDVVLHGHARAPDARAVQRMAVSLRAADRRKLLMVYGDRRWGSLGQLGAPEPFATMPLVWERAFGGPAPSTRPADVRAADENPVGIGLAARPGDPLPNLEDPEALIERPGDRPLPACLAAVAPSWGPRRRFAGTYDAHWARRRAPLLPADFQPRFFNHAPPALAFERYLVGGEPIEAVGVSVRGPLVFSLPHAQLDVQARVRGVYEAIAMQLDTVTLLPDDDLFTMTWRGKLSCDRRLLAVERIEVQLADMRLGSAA